MKCEVGKEVFNLKSYKNLPISIGKIFLAATLISLFFIAQEFADHKLKGYVFDFSWFPISSKISMTFLVWVLLSPVVFALSQSASFKNLKDSLKTISLGILLSLGHRLLVMVLISVLFFLRDGLWTNLASNDSMAVLGADIFSSAVQLIFFTSVAMFFEYQKRYLEKQKELNNAQLYALKMKLHPHFLFNTLHAISSMVDYNKEGAQKMLTRLGSLFRTILENEQEQTISLEQELKYIQDYLEIEQVRFAEQLEVEFEVSKDTLDARVPSLILQPLVENSIKHGISKMKDQGKIRIETRKISNGKGDRISLTISDNGQGFGKSGQKNFGIGIKNVSDRLARLYNEDYYFNIGEGKDCGAVAEIEIPYLKKNYE